MNKVSVLSMLIVVLNSLLVNVFAEEKTIIDRKNIYGGKTVQILFSEVDQNLTAYKIVEYFNLRGDLRKKVVYRRLTTFNDLKIDKVTELYAHDGTMQSVEVSIDAEKVKETGIARIKTHFFPDKSIKRKEIFYGKSDFDDQIYSKSVDYFNYSGAKVRTEFFLIKEESIRTGYTKLVLSYFGGKLIKEEFLE